MERYLTQYSANYEKRAHDDTTKIEKITKSEVKEIQSVNYGFNAGIAHMYSNPVEREQKEIAAIMAQQAATEAKCKAFMGKLGIA